MEFRNEILSTIQKDPRGALSLIKLYEIELSIQSNEKSPFIELYYFYGYVYYQLENFQESLFYLKKIEDEKHDNIPKELIQKTHIILGAIYRSMGDYSKSIATYDKAIEGADDSTKSVIYNNIAVIYNSIGENESALNYYNKALIHFHNIEKRAYVISILNNIGKVYFNMGDFENSIKVLQKAEELSYMENDFNLQILSQINICKVLIEYGDYIDCIIRLQKIVEDQERLEKTTYLITVHLLLGESYYKISRPEDAISSFNIVLNESSQLSSRERITVLEKVVTFFEMTKNYEEAYKVANEMLKLNFEIYNFEKKDELQELIVKFETKQKEVEINRLNKEREITNELLKKSEEIKEMNRLLSNYNNELLQYSYAISHDFREPVRMVANFVQLLSKKLKDKLDQQEEDLLSYIIKYTQRMEILIADLYKYTTLSKTETLVEYFNLLEPINSAIEFNKLKLVETHSQIIAPSHYPMVKGYKSLIVQLFTNLISNSIKYRKTNEKLIIRIKFKEEEDLLCFEITDNGIGVEENLHSKVFQLFKRGHSSQDYEGTGLGLALCQKIILKMKGDIQLFSEGIDQGTTVKFSFKKNL